MATQLMNMRQRSGERVDERGSEFIWRIGDEAEVDRRRHGRDTRLNAEGWTLCGTEKAVGRGILASPGSSAV
jgi:hypothetical protein